MTEHQKGAIAISVVAVAFASMGIFARYLSVDLQLFQQTYLRIGLAALAAALVFRPHLSLIHILQTPRHEWFVVIFRAIMLYGAVVLFTAGILNTKYANVSLVAMVPLLPLFGYFLLRERLTGQKIAYITLGFIGVVFVALKGLSLTWGVGETYALLSAICFDVSYVGRKWHIGYLNNQEITVLMLGVGATFLFVAGTLVAGESMPVLSLGAAALFALLASASFNVFHLFYSNYGFQRIDVILAGQLLMLEVPVALAYGLVLYGEVPTAYELIGGGLIVWSAWQMNKIA
jgi:drug/metabolite transporter (DMT)-like permease